MFFISNCTDSLPYFILQGAAAKGFSKLLANDLVIYWLNVRGSSIFSFLIFAAKLRESSSREILLYCVSLVGHEYELWTVTVIYTTEIIYEQTVFTLVVIRAEKTPPPLRRRMNRKTYRRWRPQKWEAKAYP